MKRITGYSEVNQSMAQQLRDGAQESVDHTEDTHRGMEFVYDQDLTDGFGQEALEVLGQHRVLANETWDQQNLQAQGVVNADGHLMNAVEMAKAGMRR
ncbi:hypothetical protein [Amycolatopsis regifaucium]|uniref:Uncharacterized protein n=1 Tax=Amycolatopsis regifaucium TaxID=546365 RepID=A0A154MA36_9PSEU|nr:hypothetical protein [Amycolatopsis regifaucium]KZB81471.1 hypothetical protein AVL48_05530 [Amycolatopsis regifaucium]OKA04734.1 hypothetical protein ATP06_0230545 [Amycolatopsis regifaucium]SFH30482.1 hypothetical protein SAMN04489731_103442 [Amycolatopsis regifaucium]